MIMPSKTLTMPAKGVPMPSDVVRGVAFAGHPLLATFPHGDMWGETIRPRPALSQSLKTRNRSTIPFEWDTKPHKQGATGFIVRSVRQGLSAEQRKRPPFQGGLMGCVDGQDHAAASFRRPQPYPAMPAMPRPSKVSVAGSGTAVVGVATTLSKPMYAPLLPAPTKEIAVVVELAVNKRLSVCH
jgi:hypothetical protein